MPTRRRAPLRMVLACAAILVVTFGVAVPAGFGREYRRGLDIRDFAFSPRTVEIRVGDTVRWTNRDSVAHSAAARNGSFDTGLLADGESASIRFSVPGTYRYICTPHPEMTGTVVVRSAGAVIVPPNTATATNGAASAALAGESRFGFLATIGGTALLLALQLLRRRRAASRPACQTTDPSRM